MSSLLLGPIVLHQPSKHWNALESCNSLKLSYDLYDCLFFLNNINRMLWFEAGWWLCGGGCAVISSHISYFLCKGARSHKTSCKPSPIVIPAVPWWIGSILFRLTSLWFVIIICPHRPLKLSWRSVLSVFKPSRVGLKLSVGSSPPPGL